MRRFLAIVLLLPILACGTAKLSKREAEEDIRQDYPVQVVIQVPENARAAAGSTELARLVGLQEGLAKTGWFTAERRSEGAQDVFSFKASPSAPKSMRLAAKGWELPVAQAVFVRAVELQTSGNSARVTYEIRLSNPTPAFSLFQSLYPDARIGQTKQRHALYRKDGHSWVLQETDETLKKVP